MRSIYDTLLRLWSLITELAIRQLFFEIVGTNAGRQHKFNKIVGYVSQADLGQAWDKHGSWDK